MNITRRAAMRNLGAGALWSLGLWPGVLRARPRLEPGQPFRFIVVNDLHCQSADCGRFLEGVIRQMRAEEPEFCLLAGDLTEKGEREHLAAVRDLFRGAGLAVYPVIGNHDYNSPTSNRYYRLFFPRRLNYWFEHRGWQFIGLDTSEGTKYQQTHIQKPTFDWVKNNLRKLEPARPTVLFTHFPLGPEVKYRPLNADDLLEHFKLFNLQAIYCGHFHGFTQKAVCGTTAFTNRCCALKRNNHDKTREKGFFVATAEGGRVTQRFVEVPLPQPAPGPPPRRPSAG